MRLVVTCDCGANEPAEAGRDHTCSACGRVWSVPELAPESAAAVAATRRRHLAGLGGSAVAFGAVGAVAGLVLGGGAALPFAAAGLVLWLVVARPALGRRYRRALEAIPGFDVHD